MKIRVQHEDGRIETLTIKGEHLAVGEGHQLDRLRTSSGMEHFFTKDGYYDGWGGAVEDARRTPEILEEIESRRDVDGSDNGRPASIH